MSSKVIGASSLQFAPCTTEHTVNTSSSMIRLTRERVLMEQRREMTMVPEVRGCAVQQTLQLNSAVAHVNAVLIACALLQTRLIRLHI